MHTWNVAGKPPPDDLDLEDWIDVSNPADIYVFGYVFKNLPISIILSPRHLIRTPDSQTKVNDSL